MKLTKYTEYLYRIHTPLENLLRALGNTLVSRKQTERTKKPVRWDIRKRRTNMHRNEVRRGVGYDFTNLQHIVFRTNAIILNESTATTILPLNVISLRPRAISVISTFRLFTLTIFWYRRSAVLSNHVPTPTSSKIAHYNCKFYNFREKVIFGGK